MESHGTQILWAINSLLIIIVAALIRNWASGLTAKFDNLSDKMICKQDKTMCNERYLKLDKNVESLFTHIHPIREGKDQSGGVIIP